MAQRLFITIGSRDRKDRVLMEMPGGSPVREWIDHLVRSIEWTGIGTACPGGHHLETEDGGRLAGGESLLAAGITGSDLLYLEPGGDEPAECIDGAEGGQAALQEAAKGISAGELTRLPRFLGPQGLVFLIENPPLNIGRAGKGSAPDIDLSNWDAGMVASRKHAVLETSGGLFFLRPEKTTNGTFLNGVEVPAGESRVLGDGDRIQFGFGGLELTFKNPQS